ncbi:MAG TPA: hypothetical protein VIV06_02795, partial [Candidatus Limnocylindrales bacterium]
MTETKRRLGGALAGVVLASLLAVSMVGPTLALTITNANPSVTVPTATPTNVGISYVWSGTTPADTLSTGTTLTVNIPAGYAWTAFPTFASSPTGTITLSGPVASNGGLTQTWTLATFGASGAWTLTLAGGTVATTNTSGTNPVTLAVGAAAPVQIASLTASGASVGSLVPVLVSPTSVVADGTSTIRLAFGAVGANCSTHTTFTVTTTSGTFTATTLPGVTVPAGGTTSVAVACANFAAVNGTTLTLTSPKTAGSGTVSVVLAPVAGGSVVDSSTAVTFKASAASGGGHGEGNGGRDEDRGNGNGARKTGLFQAGSASTTCASAAASPTAGARTLGFAILKTTGRGRLNVTVALKGALPNATFNVMVDQAGTCSKAFTVRTNGAGNGTGHQHLALVSGARSFWVTATSGSTTYVSRAVTLTIKRHGNDNDQGASSQAR